MNANAAQPPPPQAANAVQPLLFLRNCLSRLRDLIRLAIVELLLLLFQIHWGIYQLTLALFIYDKACDTLGNLSTKGQKRQFCASLLNDSLNATSDQERVTALAARVNLYMQLGSITPSIVISLLLGWFSDRCRRKPVLFLTMIGAVISATIAFSLTWQSQLSIYYLLIPAFVSGLSGNVVAMNMTAYACVSDMAAPDDNLAVRNGVLGAIIALGTMLGALLTGLLINRFDYFIVLGVADCFAVAALICALVLFREAPVGANANATQRGWWPLVQPATAEDGPRLIAGLIAAMLTIAADAGPSIVLVLFVKQSPFTWVDFLYADYSSYTDALSLIGTVVLVTITLKFEPSGETIVLVAIALAFAKWTSLALCQQTWHIFLATSLIQFIAAIFNVGSSAYFTGFQTFLPSCVVASEKGRLFAILSSCETVAPLLAGLVYPIVFVAFSDVFPAFVFVLSGGLFAIAFTIISCKP